MIVAFTGFNDIVASYHVLDMPPWPFVSVDRVIAIFAKDEVVATIPDNGVVPPCTDEHVVS